MLIMRLFSLFFVFCFCLSATMLPHYFTLCARFIPPVRINRVCEQAPLVSQTLNGALALIAC